MGLSQHCYRPQTEDGEASAAPGALAADGGASIKRLAPQADTQGAEHTAGSVGKGVNTPALPSLPRVYVTGSMSPLQTMSPKCGRTCGAEAIEVHLLNKGISDGLSIQSPWLGMGIIRAGGEDLRRSPRSEQDLRQLPGVLTDTTWPSWGAPAAEIPHTPPAATACGPQPQRAKGLCHLCAISMAAWEEEPLLSYFSTRQSQKISKGGGDSWRNRENGKQRFLSMLKGDGRKEWL